MKAKTIIIGGVGVGALAALYFYFKNKPVTPTQTTALPQTKVATEKQMENLLTPDFTREKVPAAIANLLAAPVKFIETPIVKVVDQTTPVLPVFEGVQDKFIKSIAVTLPPVVKAAPRNPVYIESSISKPKGGER